MRRYSKAAVQQATEYIIENKPALLEYFKRADTVGRCRLTLSNPPLKPTGT